MSNYTALELGDKNVAELRAICRAVGVIIPAHSLKEELIELILNAPEGQAPRVAKRGRPRKIDVEAQASQSPTSQAQANGSVPSSATEQESSYVAPATSENAVEKPHGKFIMPHRKNAYGTNGANDNQRGEYRPRPNGFRSERVNEKPIDAQIREIANDELQEPKVDPIREGYLEVNPTDGYGFLRVKYDEFSEMDAYVHQAKIKQYGLRKGDFVTAKCRLIQEGKPVSVSEVISINGIPVAEVGKRKNFDDLVPIYPNERLRLELPTNPREYAIRLIDLVAPIGKGQRGIIVSPPKAGKTTLLKLIANSISINYPDVKLFVLLIDERPEEVTDMQRSIKGEVVYSTFDELPEHHTKTSEVLLERAKRIVEMGKDVVILMDSLTRLTRAYNTTVPTSGRTLSGGVDPTALHTPKRFFGSARNIEGGGSLTIIATALVDTGSRMDEVIFEEFKGTGNMEIHLDRRLSERRIFPAIDLAKSGTRKEELLLSESEMSGIWGIRKILSAGDSAEATETLINMVTKTASNREFIDQLNRQFKAFQKDGFTFRKPNGNM